MSSARLNFPCVDATRTSARSSAALFVYRTEEGEELVESEASFGSIKLDASKQTALSPRHQRTHQG